MRISLAVLMTAALSAAAGPGQGVWDAEVTVNGVRIPFRFELNASGDQARGSFFNGEERVESTAGRFDGERLELRFDQYATKLEARWDGSRLEGTYGRLPRGLYPFRAVPEQAKPAASAGAPRIAGEWWIATRSPKGEEAWRLLVRQDGGSVSGSILRVDGDTGTLTGRWQDGRFVLSHFSGARPLLLEITPAGEDSLELVQNGRNRLTAVRASSAAARNLPAPADPSQWTRVKDDNEPFRFQAPDLSGRPVSNTDAAFQGKVLVVNVSGSWCPNCHDEAPFLAELYRAYRRRGLEVVTLSFEEREQLEDPARLRAFIRQYGLEHTVLLGGEPAQVHDRLPQAVNLNTWPATFLLDRQGRVRATHAGFASRASGEAHTRLKAELRRTIEQLLDEPAGSSR